jgi:hypothetical protein
MSRTCSLLIFCLLAVPSIGAAYEYPLQFTPNPGAQGLSIAGYAFSGNTVLGNCSYYTEQSGSGKGGGYHPTKTYYNQTCNWDQFGNLLSITPGAMTAPLPLYMNGTQTIYAINPNGDSTGTDTKIPYGGGFVNTPGSHYTWTTPNAYAVLQQMRYTFVITLVSDGDLPLNITSASATALAATARVQSTTCNGQIPTGASCSVTVLYSPLRLRSTTGLAYDTLTVNVVSDAGQVPAFVQSYTIVLRTNLGGED